MNISNSSNISTIETLSSSINGDAVATTILPSFEFKNQSQQGSNQLLNSPVYSSHDFNDSVIANGKTTSLAKSNKKIKVIGADTIGGGLASPSANFPNIYFNFKNYSHSGSGLKFKFDTDSIVSDSVSTNKWVCDPSIRSGSSDLIGDSGCLKSAKLYDKYCYELVSNKSISNGTFLLNPSFNPSYAVLVFAIANNSSTTDQKRNFSSLLQTSSIHKFIAANDTNASAQGANFYSTSLNNSFEAKAIFTAGTLNSSAYLVDEDIGTGPNQGRGSKNGDRSEQANQPSPPGKHGAINPGNDFALRGAGRLNEYIAYDTKLYDLFPYNLYYLPTDLSNPTLFQDVQVSQNGTVTNYKNFCLFFVEMRTYISAQTMFVNANQLWFETYVNGIPTFKTWRLVNKLINTEDLQNYILTLYNKNFTGGAPNNKLFLFDYLYGEANNISEMTFESRQTIMSLVSKYRNIMVKNTSDLQISNSSKSLFFPTFSSHPFTDIYLSANP